MHVLVFAKMAINHDHMVDGLHSHHHHTQTTPASPLCTPPLQQGCGLDHMRRRNKSGGHQGQTQEVGELPSASPALSKIPPLTFSPPSDADECASVATSWARCPLLSVPCLCRDDAHDINGYPLCHPHVHPDDCHITPTTHQPPTMTPHSTFHYPSALCHRVSPSMIEGA
jgi:hypothetical protein